MNRKNHRIGVGMKILTFLLLATVISSNLFHLPTYDETSQGTVIVMAMMVFTLSTVFSEAQSK